MEIVVRTTDDAGRPGATGVMAGVFSAEDWERLLELAARHGFDPEGRHAADLSPEPGELRRLGLVGAQELAVALSEAMRRETSMDDAPEGSSEEPEILVGPPDQPELRVTWATARRLGELAETGAVEVYRAERPQRS